MAPGRQPGSGRLAVGRQAKRPRSSGARGLDSLGERRRAAGESTGMLVDGYVRVSQVAARSGECFISPAVKRDQIEGWVRARRLSARRALRGARRVPRPRRPPASSAGRSRRVRRLPGHRGGQHRPLRALARPRPQRDRARYPCGACSAPSGMASTPRRAPAAWCSGSCSRWLPSRSEFNAAGLHGPCQPTNRMPGGHSRCAERHGLSHRGSRDRWGRREGVKRQAVLAAPIPRPPDPPAEAGWRRRARRRPDARVGRGRTGRRLGLGSSSESSSRARASGRRSSAYAWAEARLRPRRARSGVHVGTSSGP
jgi:hypothetical protein